MINLILQIVPELTKTLLLLISILWFAGNSMACDGFVTGSDTLCFSSSGTYPITFHGQNGTAPYTFSYSVNGGPTQTAVSGAGDSVTVNIPMTVTGSFIYTLTQTTDGVGCISTIPSTATVLLVGPTIATVSGTTTVVQNSAPGPTITFTASGGVSPYTFSYTINNGPVQTVTSAIGSSTATVIAPTSVTGTFTYSLLSVSSALNCPGSGVGTPAGGSGGTGLPGGPGSPGTQATVTVVPPCVIPTGTISMSGWCGYYTIFLSASGGSGPFTYTYTLNGVTQTTTGGSGVVINGPSVFGPTPFFFSGITVTNSAGCTGTLTGTGSIFVNPLIGKTITVSTASVCQNAASPIVTMMSNGPGPFSYTVNGVMNSGFPSGGTLNIPVPTGVPGTYVYNFTSASGMCEFGPVPSVTVTVKPLPTATISGTTAVCQGAPVVVTLTGANGTAPYTFTYKLNGGANQTISSGAGSTASIVVPTSTPGAYVYTLVSVTSAGGCSQTQTGTATVVVNSLPNATISGTTTVCQNAASSNITITGLLGSPPYTFTYNINGGPNQIISSGGGNTATIPISTSTSGVTTYNLVSVMSNGCFNTASGSAVVTVNPMPTATISGTASVCQGSASQQITFTGANGTAPYVFTYKLNGGANQTISSGAGNTATINVPAGTTGTFTYSLVSVSAVGGCNQTQTGTATVTVNPLPTASVSGTATVCQNATSPTITFTGANGTAPYTFTYNIDGGATQTVSSGAGTIATVTVPTSTAGTFIYNLLSVSASGCSQAQTGSVSVLVKPAPSATLSADSVVCQNGLVGFVFSGSGGNAPYIFTYSINGGVTQTIAGNPANLITYYVFANTPGTLTFDIFSVTNQQGCTSVVSETAQVLVNPLPVVSGDTLICEGTSTQWTGAGTPNTVNPWSSSNTSVATVDNSGLISAIAPGTAIITYTNDLGCSRERQIVVQANPLITGALDLCPGSTEQYLVNAVTANGVWTSSNLSFATINSDGIVSALSPGNVTLVYVDTIGCSATFDVQISAFPNAQLIGSDTICQGDQNPEVIFVGSNASAPYTFTYSINGNSATISSGNLSDTAVITLDSGVSGTTIVYLESVQTGQACSANVSDSAIVLIQPLPTATFSLDTDYCINEAINIVFNATSGAYPFTIGYSLNGTDYSTTTLQNFTTFTVTNFSSSAGTEFYTLGSIIDATGCLNTINDTAIVQIHNNPSISGNTEVCDGSTLQLSATGNANVLTPWYSSNNSIATVNASGLVTGISPGTVTITFVNSGGCSASLDITVLTVPTLSGDNSLCLNESTQLLVDGAASTSGIWSVANPLIASVDQNGNVTGLSTGQTLLTYENTNGCQAQMTISVNPIPVANAGPDYLGCASGGTLMLGSAPIPGNSYSWSPATGLSDPNSPLPTFATTDIGIVDYELTVTNSFGCEAVDSVQIELVAGPFGEISGTDYVGCGETELSFSVTYNPDYIYNWTINNETTGITTSDFSYTFNGSGTYNVSVLISDANGCKYLAEAASDVLIYPDVVADFTVSPEEAVITNPEFEFSNLSENADSYVWHFGNGDSSIVENPVYTYDQVANEYEVMLIASNEIGCTDTAIAIILVKDELIVYVPNTFTPGGDGVNEFFFPVITAGFEVSDYRFDIYNRWGELIFTSTNKEEGWNGTYRSLKCQVDTYVWVLRLTESGTTNVHSLEGHVNILK